MSENNAALDSLLDTELDDLADMPTFEPYPNGAHVCTIKFEAKTINNASAVELALVAISTEELENPAEDKPLVAGAETSVLYMLNNEYGQGSLKKDTAGLKQATGTTTMRALFEAVNGGQALVVTKKRYDKKRDQYFTGIVSISLI